MMCVAHVLEDPESMHRGTCSIDVLLHYQDWTLNEFHVAPYFTAFEPTPLCWKYTYNFSRASEAIIWLIPSKSMNHTEIFDDLVQLSDDYVLRCWNFFSCRYSTLEGNDAGTTYMLKIRHPEKLQTFLSLRFCYQSYVYMCAKKRIGKSWRRVFRVGGFDKSIIYCCGHFAQGELPFIHI